MKISGFTNCRRMIPVFACLMLLCMLRPGLAAAHRVTVFAWVEGETVHTESKFSGGKRVNGGEIIVYDLNGRPLLSGKTDDRGAFSFKIPQKTGMKIVLQAGMGHRGEWTISAGELRGRPEPDPAVSQKTRPPSPEARAETTPVGLDQIRLVLDQSLDRRLNPVLKMLAESRDKGPTLRDILGGIGYILGLMGLAAYVHFRRKVAEIEEKTKG